MFQSPALTSTDYTSHEHPPTVNMEDNDMHSDSDIDSDAEMVSDCQDTDNMSDFLAYSSEQISNSVQVCHLKYSHFLMDFAKQ